jgi:sulfur carrier protein ThiS
MRKLNIWINGTMLSVPSPCTVEELTALLWEGAGLRAESVVVDSRSMPDSEWGTTWLSDGARVEVFSSQFRPGLDR